MTLTTNDIRERLRKAHSSKNTPLPRFAEKLPISDSLQSAAVLMPLLENAGAWHLLFIKRTKHKHDQHSGQVAFPGGRAEDGDEDLIKTALREAEEEIGLAPSDVNVLGRLDDVITTTNYRVTPIVGKIPWPYTFTLAVDEVSSVFAIPLAWLADTSNRCIRPWTPVQEEEGVDSYPVIFYKEYKEEILWGASARMVVELVERLSVEC